MIRLTTLGGIQVVTPGSALDGMQPKRLALLVYLAAARPHGSHRRDTLVGLLWPELDQERARAALRQALHGLRRSLGTDVIASAGTESVELLRSSVCCDLWELERSFADGHHDQVLNLYQGELAAGLFLSGAPLFDQWLTTERSRVRDLVRKSAWIVAERAVDDGDAGRVVRAGTFAVSLSEFDEGALRQAMTLLARVGERATALAMYERFVSHLRAELEMQPSSETVASASKLRRVVPDVAALPAPLSVAAAPPSILSPTVRNCGSRTLYAVGLSIIALAFGAPFVRSANSELDPRRVGVGQFVNESGVPALDTIAHQLESTSRAALVRLDNAQVVASSTDLLERAGTIVRGSVRRLGDSVEFRGEVVDRVSASLLRSVIIRAASTSNLTSSLEKFTERLSAEVATVLFPGWGNALSQPPTYAGYRLFLDGMRSIRLEQHDSAAATFRRAFALDSAFTAAGLLAGTESYQLGQFAAAESLVIAIAPRRALLPPVDAHLLAWLERSLRGDRIAARHHMAAITAIAPRAEMAWLQLAIDNLETARPREALEALQHLGNDAAEADAWISIPATRAEALHLLGEHERELSSIRTSLKRHPEQRLLVNYELRALAALGRVREVEAGVRQLAAEPDGTGLDVPGTMRQVAMELAAHGQANAARNVLAKALVWYEARPPAERATTSYKLGYAHMLYLADDRVGARREYDALLREHPQCLNCLGVLGVIAARSGNRIAADQSVAFLSAATRPYLHGRNLLWASRIAAALGDRETATIRLASAFAAGWEFNVLTHADIELTSIRPDSVYRAFTRQ